MTAFFARFVAWIDTCDQTLCRVSLAKRLVALFTVSLCFALVIQPITFPPNDDLVFSTKQFDTLAVTSLTGMTVEETGWMVTAGTPAAHYTPPVDTTTVALTFSTPLHQNLVVELVADLGLSSERVLSSTTLHRHGQTFYLTVPSNDGLTLSTVLPKLKIGESVPSHTLSATTDPVGFWERPLSSYSLLQTIGLTLLMSCLISLLCTLRTRAIWLQFLILGGIFGLFFLTFNPLIQSPDETTHFLNSYALATGDLFSDRLGDQMGKFFPLSAMEFIQHAHYYQSTTDVSTVFWGPVAWDDNLADINLIGYLFTAPAMFLVSQVQGLCGLFDTQEMYAAMNYLGRFFNLCAYLALGSLTLWRTRYLQHTFFLLLLLPMSLYLGSSVSYDALLIPSCMLLVAEVLYLMGAEPQDTIRWQDVAIVLTCAFFITGIKPAYLVLFLLLFAIPITMFRSIPRYVGTIGLVLTTVCLAALPALLEGYFAGGAATPIAESVALQMQEVWRDPFGFLVVLGHTLQASGGDYLRQFVASFTWDYRNLPDSLTVVFYLSLLLVAAYECSQVNCSRKVFNILSAIVVLVLTFAVFYGLYTSFSVVNGGLNADRITGVQGRYFIPFAICFVLPFVNQKHLFYSNKGTVDRLLFLTIPFFSSTLLLLSGMLLLHG